MAKRENWTRDQLLIALRLYLRTPFGRLHGRNPEIVKLAEQINRTPSALAMKACNFASLDPAFRATKRTGLSGTSEADRAIWNEFNSDSEQVAAEAEDTAARYGASTDISLPAPMMPKGPTDALQLIRVRRVQSFFRAAVLTSYESRCAISGLRVRNLLVASHIIPWGESVERRADPRNGLCLNALFDRAFDRGLLTIDERYHVVVSAELRRHAESAELDCSLAHAHGRVLHMPVRFAPDPAALAFHREHIFVA
jgi:hypothetical protein